MYTLGAPLWWHLVAAVFVAAAVGFTLSWLIDRFILRLVTDDRVSGIALGCALSFVILMAGTSYLMTRSSGIPNGPILIPPFSFALSFLAGTAVAGGLRMWLYGRQYEVNDDQLWFEPDYDDQSRYDQEVLEWDEKNAGRNYFVRHWAGHLSLPVSYWVNGALFSALVLAAVEYLTGKMTDGDVPLRVIAGVAVAYLFLSFLLWIWSSVGIWRSAYWHRRRGGAAGWAMAARVLVVLSAVLTIVRSGNLALYANELGQLAMGNDSLGNPAQLTVSNEGRSLLLVGNITEGTAKRFQTALRGNAALEEIVLTSQGGRIVEAQRMAAMIAERRLNTRVDDYCMSACTHLLLAGAKRTAPHLARIGFHQPALPGLSSSAMRDQTDRMRQDYLAKDVHPAFVARALATPSESMWFPSYEELAEAKILSEEAIVVGVPQPDTSVSAESRSGKRLAAMLAAEAAAVNLTAPRKLDSITTLERATASGFTLTNHYIVNLKNIDVPTSRRNVLASTRANLCSNLDSVGAIRDGARFAFNYLDARGRPLFNFTIEDCA